VAVVERVTVSPAGSATTKAVLVEMLNDGLVRERVVRAC
jgi:hypothetical protein